MYLVMEDNGKYKAEILRSEFETIEEARYEISRIASYGIPLNTLHIIDSETNEEIAKTKTVYVIAQTTFSEFKTEVFENAYKTFVEAVRAVVNYICESSEDEMSEQECERIFDTFIEDLCYSDGEDYYEIHAVEVVL